jgi:diguanylate cyclase (GGDEF)-like protein/PAS domain S-box-containing protein
MDTKTRPDAVTLDDGLATARLHTLLDHAPLAMAFVRGERFELVSDHMTHLFGYDDGVELGGLPTRVTQVTDAAHAMLAERLAASFGAGRPLDEEIEVVRRDGSRFWARLHATPVAWEAPAADALWVIEDVTVARQLRMQPTWSGRHDPVTELANRREFQRRLADHVGSQRHVPVSVLWLDVDHFSHVASRLGAQAADRFLLLIGRLLVSKVRASDVVARIDADRFGVLLPECDQQHAQFVGEKLRSALAAYRLRWGAQSTKLKACVGVVQLHRSLDTVEAVLEAAEKACGAAKAAGGDSVRVFVHQPTDTQLSALD